MVGAELKNLVNEAALLAARRHHEKVESVDFADALERIVLGTARTIMISPEEKRRTAYHESGHALLGMLTIGADPVRKVSIIPRGQALGVTLQTPEADRYGYSASYLRGRITGALGGRAAEELVFDDFTTGAEVRPGHGHHHRPPDGRALGHVAGDRAGLDAPATRAGAVRLRRQRSRHRPPARSSTPRSAASSTSATPTRVETLRAHRENLDRLAERLLDAETLDEDEAYEAAGLPRVPDSPEALAGATSTLGSRASLGSSADSETFGGSGE